MSKRKTTEQWAALIEQYKTEHPNASNKQIQDALGIGNSRFYEILAIERKKCGEEIDNAEMKRTIDDQKFIISVYQKQIDALPNEIRVPLNKSIMDMLVEEDPVVKTELKKIAEARKEQLMKTLHSV